MTTQACCRALSGFALAAVVSCWSARSVAQSTDLSTAEPSKPQPSVAAFPIAEDNTPDAVKSPLQFSDTVTSEQPAAATPSSPPSVSPVPSENLAAVAIAPPAAVTNALPEVPPGFATEFPRYPTQVDSGTTPVRQHGVQPRSLAVMLDVGVPDGAVLGVAYRPAFWTRLQAGAGTNSISPGMRAGAALIPFSEGPSLTVEGGYYFEGDASAIVTQFAGHSHTRTAQQVGYQFVNFHVGLDFGSRYSTFFLHGGMTYLHTILHDANDALGGQSVNSQGEVTTYTFNQDVNVSVWFPSFKLGFLVYIA